MTSEAGFRLATRADVKAMAKYDISDHENNGLGKAFMVEKKKR
jgi:hypothetical protein